jgi:hypothetical protein
MRQVLGVGHTRIENPRSRSFEVRGNEHTRRKQLENRIDINCGAAGDHRPLIGIRLIECITRVL